MLSSYSSMSPRRVFAARRWHNRSRALTRRDLLIYSLPNAGTVALGMPVSLYLGPFYSEDVGFSLVVVGAVLAAMRVWDLVTDFVIGHFSDQLRTVWGRRRPLILLATPGLMISVWLLFSPPDNPSLAFLILTISALYIFWTAISINHSAWAAELTLDYDTRTRLLGWAQFSGLAATCGMLALPAVLEL